MEKKGKRERRKREKRREDDKTKVPRKQCWKTHASCRQSKL